MMLKKSCDKLPYNIALVFASKENKKEIVIGHSRLSSVVAHPNYAFVESGLCNLCPKVAKINYYNHKLSNLNKFKKISILSR